MEMDEIILDDSVLNFDSWLTEEILKDITEQVFGVTILDE